MNKRNNVAKITNNNIDNFTIQQYDCNNIEENDNKINNNNNGRNNQICQEDKICHENNKMSSYIDFDKEKKRAPLGEIKINSTGIICPPIDNSLNHQLLPKKRTERFEVCLDCDNDEAQDDNLEVKNNEEFMKSTNNTDIWKKHDISENEEFVECDNSKVRENRPELLSPLPGKENVMPKITPSKKDDNGYSSFYTGSCSTYNTDKTELVSPKLVSPSECLTSKSSLSISQLKGQLTINDPLYISYEEDIYKWMLHREKSYRPRTNFMEKQTHINAEMRSILIDWFVDVVVELELSPASFFLAVSLTDRTLSIVDCPRERLQLLGATSVLVSTKVQEIFPPLVKDIVFVTDDSYSENQVRKMEKVILRVTDFQLNLPLVDSFAQLYDNSAAISDFPLNLVARNLMWYFLELSTFDCSCINILPSRLAASAFVLALSFQNIRQKIEIPNEKGNKLWSDEMVKKTKIMRSELEEPAKLIINLQQKAVSSKFQALYRKFSCPKRCKVACLKPLEFEEIASQFSDD